MSSAPGPSSSPAGTDVTGLGITIEPAGPVTDEVSVDKAWSNLVKRIGTTTPRLVQDGHRLLNGVDRITGLRSR